MERGSVFGHQGLVEAPHGGDGLGDLSLELDLFELNVGQGALLGMIHHRARGRGLGGAVSECGGDKPHDHRRPLTGDLDNTHPVRSSPELPGAVRKSTSCAHRLHAPLR